MGHGFQTVFTVTMASGGSLTSAIDLQRGFPSVYIQISSTPSGSEYRFRASDTLAGVYSTVYHPSLNSSTVGVNPYVIPSSVTGVLIPIPAGGFRFLKIYATAAMDNGAVYKLYCGDE